jgi:glycosyltransferase involved in cell wall biosynthesis
LKSGNSSPKVTKLIQDNVLAMPLDHEIICLTDWYGPRSIAGIRVRNHFRRNLLRFLKDLRFLSLHPISVTQLNFEKDLYFEIEHVAKVLRKKFVEVYIYSDVHHSSKVLSDFLTLSSNKSKIVVKIVTIEPSETAHCEESLEITPGTIPSEALLVIQPDWMYCGSAKTFDLVGHLAVQKGYFLIRIVTGTDTEKNKLKFGQIHANGVNESFPGMSLKLNFSSLSSKLRLFISLFRVLFSSKRRSVVEFKNEVYGALRLDAKARAMVEQISPKYIYVNHHFNMPLAVRIQKQLQKAGTDPQIILDSHDLQYRNYWEQNYKSPFTMYFGSQNSEQSIELSQFRKADTVVFVSEDERQEYLKYLDGNGFEHNRTIHALPIRFSERKFESIYKEKNKKKMIGIFMSDNTANRISLSWFIKQILPQISTLHADFLIFGGIAKAAVDYPKHPSIQFRGFVESIEDAYDEIDIVCLPVVLGNGIAIKTLEAFNFGKPVIGTELAGRGLQINDSKLFIRSSIQFIDSLRDLIQSDDAISQNLKEIGELKTKIMTNSYVEKFDHFFDSQEVQERP